MINLREVSFIDGDKEFYINETVTELLSQNSNIFPLKEKPLEESITFTGDSTLFKVRVYKEEDLNIKGSYLIKLISGVYTLIINSNLKTSTNTFTYITYKNEVQQKINGLYSVDYEKGILYTSTPVKNIKINYRNSIQYYKGKELLQNNFNTYTTNNINSVEDNSLIYYVYQIKDKNVNDMTNEYIQTPKLNVITRDDNYGL